ncbi:hypothetical protein [Streptomyces lunaelactis]|nr:hypothetical protein [Streptomyces lunaelactis]
MALRKTMPISELRTKNEASQVARQAEKAAKQKPTPGTPKKG